MKQKTVNLNVLTLRFPVTAWVSIAHRLSGLLLVFLIPGLLWGLQYSLGSKADFVNLQQRLQTPCNRVWLWMLITALLYHGVAGIRHLLLDQHIGESKSGGRRGAYAAILVSVLLSLWVGYRIW